MITTYTPCGWRIDEDDAIYGTVYYEIHRDFPNVVFRACSSHMTMDFFAYRQTKNGHLKYLYKASPIREERLPRMKQIKKAFNSK